MWGSPEKGNDVTGYICIRLPRHHFVNDPLRTLFCTCHFPVTFYPPPCRLSPVVHVLVSDSITHTSPLLALLSIVLIIRFVDDCNNDLLVCDYFISGHPMSGY